VDEYPNALLSWDDFQAHSPLSPRVPRGLTVGTVYNTFFSDLLFSWDCLPSKLLASESLP
jgi:hypothetical protein